MWVWSPLGGDRGDRGFAVTGLNPRFSPDGKWLLDTAQGRDQDDVDIHSVEIDGHTPRPLVASPRRRE